MGHKYSALSELSHGTFSFLRDPGQEVQRKGHKIFHTPHTVYVIEVMLVLLRIPRIYGAVTTTI